MCLVKPFSLATEVFLFTSLICVSWFLVSLPWHWVTTRKALPRQRPIQQSSPMTAVKEEAVRWKERDYSSILLCSPLLPLSFKFIFFWLGLSFLLFVPLHLSSRSSCFFLQLPNYHSMPSLALLPFSPSHPSRPFSPSVSTPLVSSSPPLPPLLQHLPFSSLTLLLN